MWPAVIALSVLLLGALVFGVVKARAASASAAGLRALEADAAQLARDLDTERARAAREAAGAVAATARAEAAEQRAKTETAKAVDAEQRAKAAAAELSSARASADLAVDRAEQERVRAEQERERAEQERSRAEAERARAEHAGRLAEEVASQAGEAVVRATAAEQALVDVRRTLDPPGLWMFERRRMARLWRDWVSVTLDGTAPIPYVPGTEAAQRCVEILASASREECGVPIDLAWQLPPATDLSVEAVLVLLRAAEELVATARRTNGGELSVTAVGPDLVVALATEPDQVVPLDLVPASTDVGWRVAATDASLTVCLPGLLTEKA